MELDEVLERILKNNTDGMDEDSQRMIGLIHDLPAVDELPVIVMLYKCFHTAADGAAPEDVAARIGLDVDLMGAFARFATGHVKEIVGEMPEGAFGSMMFALGMVTGIEWQEHRHA